MKPVLGKELVRTLNDKHGYFQHADAQGDVSVAFANEAVELFLGLSVEATEAFEATGLTPSQLQAHVAELEASLAAEREVHVSVSSASDDELTKTRDALRRLEVSANSVAYCYRHRPENFAGALLALEDDASFAREVSGDQP